jgi:hypothetical protein
MSAMGHDKGRRPPDAGDGLEAPPSEQTRRGSANPAMTLVVAAILVLASPFVAFGAETWRETRRLRAAISGATDKRWGFASEITSGNVICLDACISISRIYVAAGALSEVQAQATSALGRRRYEVKVAESGRNFVRLQGDGQSPVLRVDISLPFACVSPNFPPPHECPTAASANPPYVPQFLVTIDA